MESDDNNMKLKPHRNLLALLGVVAALFVSGCGETSLPQAGGKGSLLETLM